MSKLMQLPEIFIRGAIASQTMAKLTTKEVEVVDKIVRRMIDDPYLAADKHEFVAQLGNTIRGDYRSDRAAALQEFTIAIWRATVYLLYHRDYSYVCSLCHATEYQTIIGKTHRLDRQYKICPYCHQTKYKNKYYKVEKGVRGYVGTANDNTTIGPYRDKIALEKIVTSPITTIYGISKIEDPHKILNDEVQRGKWYTVWVWNYFRQILNENIIRMHNRRSAKISGPAERIAFQLITNELDKGSYKYAGDDRSDRHQATITTNILATEPEFSLFLRAVRNEYLTYNVDVRITASAITITPVGETPIIGTMITAEEQVMMMSMDTGSNHNDDNDHNWHEVIEYKDRLNSNHGHNDNDKMVYTEVLTVIRQKLGPDAQIAFDVFNQSGPAWQEYSAKWGDKPRTMYLAKFLEMTPKQVNAVKAEIAKQCSAHLL